MARSANIGQNVLPFTGNDDISILVKNSRVGQKIQTSKQTNNYIRNKMVYIEKHIDGLL